ncbi:MAG: glycerophosphodiester phosphodiesterase family protein [Actinomycetota bacterium]
MDSHHVFPGSTTNMSLNRRNLLLSAAAASTAPFVPVPAIAAPVRDKIIIAHRGASAYLPEHTLAAYAMAHAQGADFIEPDVILTRDGVPICLHDLWLETTTNVAARFPDRKRKDGHWYAIDFDLAEIKSLDVYGRVPAARREKLAGFRVATFEELILLVQELNRTTKRSVGLLVESKGAGFHLKEGKPLEGPLLATLTKHGHEGPDALTPIQCFEADHLKRLRVEHKSKLPLMFLTSRKLTDAEMDDVATYGNGVNPNRGVIETMGRPVDDNAFVKAAHRRNLKVFVWTFNDEEPVMRRFLREYGVDGVIVNNPDVGSRAVVKP